MVAATGALLILFLLVHVSGNLLILKGPSALNAYADWLQGHPLLWVFRGLLLALLATHILTTKQLAHENRAARPVRYRRLNRRKGGLYARTMLLSGIALLGFLIFHLLHLTLRWVGPVVTPLRDAAGRVDVFSLVVSAFSDPLLTVVYLLAIVLLGMHLVHALQSLVQTLGFNHDSYRPYVRGLTIVISLSIVSGFASIPLLVQFGVVGAGHG